MFQRTKWGKKGSRDTSSWGHDNGVLWNRLWKRLSKIFPSRWNFNFKNTLLLPRGQLDSSITGTDQTTSNRTQQKQKTMSQIVASSCEIKLLTMLQSFCQVPCGIFSKLLSDNKKTCMLELKLALGSVTKVKIDVRWSRGKAAWCYLGVVRGSIKHWTPLLRAKERSDNWKFDSRHATPALS